MDDQFNNDNIDPIDENLHNQEDTQIKEPEIIQEGPPKELEGNTRILSGFAHLGNALAPFTFISGFASLIIYFVCLEKNDKKLNFQTKQAFILFLLIVAASIVFTIIGMLFSIVTMGFGACLVVPASILIGLAVLCYTIYITVIVFMGKNYRIPYVAEWADKYGK